MREGGKEERRNEGKKKREMKDRKKHKEIERACTIAHKRKSTQYYYPSW